jgi:hypothetical protein
MPVIINSPLRPAMHKFLSLLFVGLFAFARTVKAQQTWEVGVTIGTSGYIGDFNPNNPLKFTDPAYGIFLKRNLNDYFSVKLSGTHATISGSDSQSQSLQMQQRNLSFFSDIDELSLIGELNFFSYIPLIGKNSFTPFIFAGIGTASYNPKATYNGADYELRPLMTEGQQTPYKQSAIVIPFGAGFKYNFTGQWNFIVDLGYRITNTGYLDDVKGVYADKSILTSDIARALADRSGESTGNYIGSTGSQRGNYRNDTYMVLGFTISYTFLTSKCYSFN